MQSIPQAYTPLKYNSGAGLFDKDNVEAGQEVMQRTKYLPFHASGT